MSSTHRVVTGLLQSVAHRCNALEIHVLKSLDRTMVDWARVDIAHDEAVRMMHVAMTALSFCKTRQYQSSYPVDQQVELSSRVGVTDMRLSYPALPLLWMEWNMQRTPQTTSCRSRHCLRREICCGECVALCFETTSMDETSESVYRVWVQVEDMRNHEAVAAGVTRALDALNVNR